MAMLNDSTIRLGALVGTVTLAGWLVLGGIARATHTPDVTDDEAKCQLKTSLVIAKFVNKKAKCVDACQKRAFKNPSLLPDCSPPFGGSTFGCVTTAEGKSAGKIKSSCAKDCPECYSGGDCHTEADVKIAAAEAHVDALLADVFCDDTGSTDGLTNAEFKCQRAVRKFATKFLADKMKCYAKCRKGEHKGKVAVGDCEPPPADLKTQLCIQKRETRWAERIDTKCEFAVNPSADKPECGSYPANDGAAWVAAEEAEVDAQDAGFYCGS
jgi:hypothetical protein